MIPGYNHNIKYKDRIYHVQTEDSGLQNPHVITHLFVGGNIVETRKTSYADIVHSDRLKEVLVEIMQDQHKGMLKDLINGRFDDKIAARSVNAATLNGPAPLNVEAGAQQRASFMVGGGETSGEIAAKPAAPAQAQSAPAPAKPAAPAVPAPKPTPAPAAAPLRPTPSVAATAPAPATAAPLGAPRPPAATPIAPAKPAAVPARAIPSTPAVAPLRPTAPPPTAPVPPSSPAIPVTPPAARPGIGAPPSARPAAPAAQPAAAAASSQASQSFGNASSSMVIEAEMLAKVFDSKDENAVDSIFGEDLISEKSLDEVILSYLAEDMQKE